MTGHIKMDRYKISQFISKQALMKSPLTLGQVIDEMMYKNDVFPHKVYITIRDKSISDLWTDLNEEQSKDWVEIEMQFIKNSDIIIKGNHEIRI